MNLINDKKKYISFNFENIPFVCFLTLIFLMMFAPTIYTEQKTILLLIIFLFEFFKILNNKFSISIRTAILACILSILGAFSLLYSLNYGNTRISEVLSLYVLYPTLITFISNSINKPNNVIIIIKSIFIFTLVINLYQLWYVFHILSIIKYFYYFPLNLRSSYVDNIFMFFSDNTAQNYFMFPFLISFFIYSLIYKKYLINKIFILITIFIQSLTLILVGQRSAYLLVFLTLFFLSLTLLFKYKSKFIFLIFNLKFLSLSFIFCLIFYFSNFFKYIKIIFDIKMAQNQTNSYSDRFFQINRLFEWWKEKPLLGWGLGNSDLNTIRDRGNPWAYESYFVYLIGAIGVIGLLTYISTFLYLIYNLLNEKNYNTEQYFKEFNIFGKSIAVALLSFMGPCFFNPYLPKFDMMWIFILPLLLLNQFGSKLYLNIDLRKILFLYKRT
ncbi:hypothetical protein GCL60_13395 [Silvanigrella paludirubra]|uniref:O-antigen ligase-related domain-containing protein n=1 Tax=Silvanigrella paludirubra TaxID=2499159 RepID=A0A6N6VP77_9BACT|nr:O-antigen ligase family protein [Silvanigrella paludirubra]KAB8036834.1 hypothetical protein GCL60_13395 [Silvanigrella paludirubra]